MNEVGRFLLAMLFVIIVIWVARIVLLQTYKEDYSPMGVFCRDELKGTISYRANHTICVKPDGTIVELE